MYNLLYKYFKEKTNIEKEKFDEVCKYLELKLYKKNEYLLKIGQECKSIYFVNRGCLRLYNINKEGQEMTRYFAFEGKFGTALSSFIEQRPSFENIQSLLESEVLTISRKDFYFLVETIPEVNFIYRDILEMAYVTSQKRIYGFQGNTALERLRWLMEYHPKILSKLSNKVIATYLGITPYTLSRLKTKL